MIQIADDWLHHPAAQTVCALLTDRGFQALFVGGCVRNALLGAPVTDYDIATDAVPAQVMALAQGAGIKVVPTGIDHGTVTLVQDKTPFEITTFRADVETDGRHAVVRFSTDVTEDARRRDFTMNALYARPDGTVLDPLNNLPDLQSRKVRFIEDPAKRIAEDVLRILRFFRFTAWYADPVWGIDRDGLAACAAAVEGLDRLSRERITAEVLKLLSAPDPSMAMAAMARTGALARIIPGAVTEPLPVLVHLEQDAFLPDPIRRLACLGGDVTPRLRLSKAQSAALAKIQSDVPLPQLAYQEGADIAINAGLVRAASTSQPIDPAMFEKLRWAAAQRFPLAASDLSPPLKGPRLGAALKDAERRWIASGFKLTKEDLLG